MVADLADGLNDVAGFYEPSQRSLRPCLVLKTRAWKKQGSVKEVMFKQSDACVCTVQTEMGRYNISCLALPKAVTNPLCEHF
jgi:hypothetical protein